MQQPPESKECNPGSSWKFAKQSWNSLEFSATQEVPSSKQYNPGRVRNFPRDFQATVRNKPGAKLSHAKNSWCEKFPPLCNTICLEGNLNTSHRRTNALLGPGNRVAGLLS